MEIKTYSCGICKKFIGTRKGLREHLRTEHFILKQLTNFKSIGEAEGKFKQGWWITK